MSASIAWSKVSGCSETGFAFGMRPPLANGVARSSADTSCWHASAAACSAFCYYVRKDVWVLAVVVSERKLRQVQRQVILTHLVIRADDPTLEQTPKAVQVVGMDVAPHVFSLLVIHDLMGIFAVQPAIAWVFVRCHQRDTIPDGFADQLAHGYTISILDQFAHDIPFASNGPNDGSFGLFRHVLFLVPMPVLVPAADIGFIHFHFAHQLGERTILHGRPNPMAHIPGRAVVAASDLAMDLQGTDAFLALRHQVNDLKPRSQWIVGVLKDRLGDDREPIAITSAAGLGLAHPMKRLALQFIDFGVVAAWAGYAVRPSLLLQELLTCLFGGEPMHQRGQRESGFRGHGVLAFC